MQGDESTTQDHATVYSLWVRNLVILKTNHFDQTSETVNSQFLNLNKLKLSLNIFLDTVKKTTNFCFKPERFL